MIYVNLIKDYILVIVHCSLLRSCYMSTIYKNTHQMIKTINTNTKTEHQMIISNIDYNVKGHH